MFVTFDTADWLGLLLYLVFQNLDSILPLAPGPASMSCTTKTEIKQTRKNFLRFINLSFIEQKLLLEYVLIRDDHSFLSGAESGV